MKTSIKQNLYKNLLAEMLKDNLEQSDIANSLGITFKCFTSKLSGETPFDLKECIKIKSLLSNNQLSLAYLFETKKLFF